MQAVTVETNSVLQTTSEKRKQITPGDKREGRKLCHDLMNIEDSLCRFSHQHWAGQQRHQKYRRHPKSPWNSPELPDRQGSLIDQFKQDWWIELVDRSTKLISGFVLFVTRRPPAGHIRRPCAERRLARGTRLNWPNRRQIRHQQREHGGTGR